jgi:hypothetical protein
MASRAYIDSIAGGLTFKLSRLLVAWLEHGGGHVYHTKLEDDKTWGNYHWWVELHQPSPRAIRWFLDQCESGEAAMTKLHVALDVDADTRGQAIERARWMGKHQTQSHVRRKRTYVGDFIKMKGKGSETDGDMIFQINPRKRGKRQRGREFNPYGDIPSRHHGGPVTHVEWRLWGIQAIRRICSKLNVRLGHLDEGPAPLVAIIKSQIRLRSVRWDKIHDKLVRPRHRLGSAFVPRSRAAVIERACSSMAQRAMDMFRRPRYDPRVIFRTEPMPQWLEDGLKDALAHPSPYDHGHKRTSPMTDDRLQEQLRVVRTSPFVAHRYAKDKEHLKRDPLYRHLSAKGRFRKYCQQLVIGDGDYGTFTSY